MLNNVKIIWKCVGCKKVNVLVIVIVIIIRIFFLVVIISVFFIVLFFEFLILVDNVSVFSNEDDDVIFV